MSARSCSLACRVFFKRDPLVLEEAPHCAVARRCAALGQLGHQRPQCQVRLRGDPSQQPFALALQPQLPPPAHLLGGRAAARAPPTPPHGPPSPKTAPPSPARCGGPPPNGPRDPAGLANRVLPSDARPPPQSAS